MPADPAAKAVFLDAIALADSAARAALVGERCGRDPELRARVDALLAANDRALAEEGTATFGPGRAGPTADYPGRDERAGAVIAGKYTLVEVVGEGGMGAVWRARQTEPVRRFVAVKLIKAGMDSKQVLARFEAERQALAVMDHPNIAKVLDGGLHDGRPFFVMELVKGTPITDYCDHFKLTPRERLELFVPVCQAIQHAHQKGVIHRDIKPSNVLVALYDDKPVVKVIDFGVAKATGGALTERTIDTGFGGVVGTPQYMSPEQAMFNNLDVDTRSDVYALGVLLYELLTGATPFARKDLERRGLLEILRVVREEEPPRPSTKLSTADALPRLSASRGTEPRKLTVLLRNELDWIVMKALEKDRARRYETASGFAADVNRYLSGEAVQAHPPSTAYRVKKFVRRNRRQVIAAGLVLVALLAGMAGTTAGLFEAKRQERLAVAARQAEAARAEGERLARLDAQASAKLAGERLVQAEAERTKADAAKVEAQVKAAEANAVVQFVEDQVFAAARPKGQDGGLGAGVTLRDAIAACLPALETGFAEQPLVEARLRMALGRTFQTLGDPRSAAEQQGRARAIYAGRLGPDHPATITSMNNLADTYAELSRGADALKLHEETLATRRRVLPPDHPDTLQSMNNLAGSLIRLDRGAEAIPLLDEFLIKAGNSPALDPGLLSRAFNLRGQHFQKSGDPAGCRATADMWEKRNRRVAGSLYAAAGFWAVTAGVQAKATGADAARLARADADRAMEWLNKAVGAGYKDAALLKRDPALDPLRDRDDFKEPLAELEARREPMCGPPTSSPRPHLTALDRAPEPSAAADTPTDLVEWRAERTAHPELDPPRREMRRTAEDTGRHGGGLGVWSVAAGESARALRRTGGPMRVARLGHLARLDHRGAPDRSTITDFASRPVRLPSPISVPRRSDPMPDGRPEERSHRPHPRCRESSRR